MWPLSRPDRPKPFVPLLGERTLFQQTLDRVSDEERFAPPVIVCGAAHTKFVAEQAGAHSLIVEPTARNTAPAIALAAAGMPADALLLVCPSDHHIADSQAFLEAIDKAAALAAQGLLVCFGIKPDHPETGYGYIQRGSALGEGYEVARFVEKPDERTARRFLDDGEFMWNGGIFLFRAGDFLGELARHRPEMARRIEESVSDGVREGQVFRPDMEAFAAIEAESIDYAVMEHTGRAAMVSCDMGWSDIGDWNALMAARERAGMELLAVGTRCLDAEGVMTISDGPNISLIGIENAVVVVDGNEILVVSRDAAQSVGKLNEAKTQ